MLSFSSKGYNRQDSLLKVIANSSSDSVISSAYLDLATITSINNPKRALIYVNKSITYFSKFSKSFQYLRYQKKATIFRMMGELDSSIYYNNLVYSNALKNNIPKYLCEAYGEYGLLSISQNNFQKSIEYFQKQLAIAKKYNFKEQLAGVYNNIGIAYGNKGDWDMAKEYFSKSLKDNLKNNKIP